MQFSMQNVVLLIVFIIFLMDAPLQARAGASCVPGQVLFTPAGTVAGAAEDSLTITETIKSFHESGEGWMSAIEKLRALGERSIPLLCTAAKDSNDLVRLRAFVVLTVLGKNAVQAVPVFLAGLEDQNDGIRLQCVYALRCFPGNKSVIVPALDKVLRNGSPLVRRAAMESMRTMVPGYFTQAPDVHTVIARADSMIPELQKKLHVPGVAMVIIKNNEIVHRANFGVANVNDGSPVTDETMFEACSMSKPLFSYLALSVIATGKLKLDEPVWRIYDDPACMQEPDRKSITPRMLLSHCSGFPNWRPGDESSGSVLPIMFKPGAKFSYSGEGMFYLQKVIEKITGTPLDVYARQTILQQLGMQHSSYVWNETVGKNQASGHDERGVFKEKTAYKRANAGYSLYCSAGDYALFLLEMMKHGRTGKYTLNSKYVQMMLSRQIAAVIRNPIERPGRAFSYDVYWGLGWGINATASHDIYYHSGANGSGFRCYSQFNPAEGSGIVIMTNSSSGSELWEAVIKEIGDL